MKKRLLALALCLVMATSLLPITAAAWGTDTGFVYVTGNGFVQNGSGDYILDGDSFTVQLNGTNVSHYVCQSKVLYRDVDLTTPVTNDPADGGTYYLNYQLYLEPNETDEWIVVESDKLWNALKASEDCSLTIPGYTTSYCDVRRSGYRIFNIIFQVAKNHEHQWKFTTTQNSLKAKCDASGCDIIGEVSVTITAQSVTLPDGSPFNAELKFEGDFKEVFHCSEINYQYEDPTTGWMDIDDPDAFTPKPGNYQAGVLISGLPTNGGAASRAARADNSTNQSGTAYLYVKYTASDPAITAQTGDNRPIELMMGSIVVFSALAAAAFALDSKRRSHH